MRLIITDWKIPNAKNEVNTGDTEEKTNNKKKREGFTPQFKTL